MGERGSVHKWVDSVVMAVAAGAVLWALVLRPWVGPVEPPPGPQERVREVTGTIVRERLKVGGGAPWEPGRVVVVEAVDYECPACRGFQQTVFPELEQHLAQTVTFAYLNLPLETHSHSLVAALAVECAAAQGSFVAMHERLFAQPLIYANTSGYAQEIGLDLDEFRACLVADTTRAAVDGDIATVRELVGRLATPTFLLGWARADGGVDVERAFVGALPPVSFRTEVERLTAVGPPE